jgi:hypothetical protein
LSPAIETATAGEKRIPGPTVGSAPKEFESWKAWRLSTEGGNVTGKGTDTRFDKDIDPKLFGCRIPLDIGMLRVCTIGESTGRLGGGGIETGIFGGLMIKEVGMFAVQMTDEKFGRAENETHMGIRGGLQLGTTGIIPERITGGPMSGADGEIDNGKLPGSKAVDNNLPSECWFNCW